MLSLAANTAPPSFETLPKPFKFSFSAVAVISSSNLFSDVSFLTLKTGSAASEIFSFHGFAFTSSEISCARYPS